MPHNKSAFRHSEFVTQAIAELLANGCIVEHNVPPFCVDPITVAEWKKLRLVIDLRHINNYLVKFIFKYEDLRSLSQILEEGHWLFTWDLKSGYHHADICSEHQAYLDFVWSINGVLKFFLSALVALVIVFYQIVAPVAEALAFHGAYLLCIS